MYDDNPKVVPTTPQPQPLQSSANSSCKAIKQWDEKNILNLVWAFCIESLDAAGPRTNEQHAPLRTKIAPKYKEIAENEGYYKRAERGCENKWKSVLPLCSRWISTVATLSALNKSCVGRYTIVGRYGDLSWALVNVPIW